MTESAVAPRRTGPLYGPVPSRRLGRSLGVDLVPYKTCSYDCIYCQLGRTTCQTLERAEYVPTGQVLEALERSLRRGSVVDFIGVAGSGEPTLHAGIGEVIAGIRRRTRIPVAVLTNGSLLGDAELRRDLARAQVVIPSLDAGEARTFRRVNRPHPDLSFEGMVEGLAAFAADFRGEIWLEIMFVAGINTSPQEVHRIARRVEGIGPQRIQLNTVVRPPAERFAKPVSRTKLQELARRLGEKAECIADFPSSAPGAARADRAVDRDILELLARRPCTVADLAAGLVIHPQEAVKHLEHLLRRGLLAAEQAPGGERYFRCKRARPARIRHKAQERNLS
ncbi:MAG: radical SAM protein [Desulfobacterales bacterium]